ncbi:hypothetical protein V6O07_23615 [Arthrospira platensis SPKY2]
MSNWYKINTTITSISEPSNFELQEGVFTDDNKTHYIIQANTEEEALAKAKDDILIQSLPSLAPLFQLNIDIEIGATSVAQEASDIVSAVNALKLRIKHALELDGWSIIQNNINIIANEINSVY